MPKLKVGRAVSIGTDLQTVRSRLLVFADLYGLRMVADADGAVEFARGGLLGELFSFDVQNAPTRMRVELEGTSASATFVTATLGASTRFGLFTAADRASLEKQLDVLCDMLQEGST